ncbi:hypothetical protein [Kiloniella sp. b19]|uniref:hypothetical protein n=1 Tax=Kiloniella sp. GXU_MW_B19 TaxID=3141326 RepID=UPI0031E0E179
MLSRTIIRNTVSGVATTAAVAMLLAGGLTAELQARTVNQTTPQLQLKQAAPQLQLKQGRTASPASAPLTAAYLFQPQCAGGFQKAGHVKKPGSLKGWTDWYGCKTATLVCPRQKQPADGYVSFVKPKAVVKQMGNPEGGAVSFQIQYVCDYQYKAPPTP